MEGIRRYGSTHQCTYACVSEDLGEMRGTVNSAIPSHLQAWANRDEAGGDTFLRSTEPRGQVRSNGGNTVPPKAEDQKMTRTRIKQGPFPTQQWWRLGAAIHLDSSVDLAIFKFL